MVRSTSQALAPVSLVMAVILEISAGPAPVGPGLRYADNPALGAFPGEFGTVRYGEGLLIGYRWYDARQLGVAYPFGFELSSTRFTLTDLPVQTGTDSVTVHRPEQELREFTRVALKAGASETVTIELDARAFAYWHQPAQRWVVEGGDFGIRVGTATSRSSKPSRWPAKPSTPALEALASAEVWLAHPEGGPWLEAALDGHPFAPLLFDPINGEMMRAIPLQRLSRFPTSRSPRRRSTRPWPASAKPSCRRTPDRDVSLGVVGERVAVPVRDPFVQRHAGQPGHQIELGGPGVAMH